MPWITEDGEVLWDEKMELRKMTEGEWIKFKYKIAKKVEK